MVVLKRTRDPEKVKNIERPIFPLLASLPPTEVMFLMR